MALMVKWIDQSHMLRVRKKIQMINLNEPNTTSYSLYIQFNARIHIYF